MKRFVILLLALGLILALGAAAAQAENFQAGDYVTFGHYEQDGSMANGGESIRWLILDVDGDELLLLSEKGLETHLFNAASDGTMWSGSAVRRWLNQEFYKAAFSEEERKAILTTTVEDTLEHGNPEWNTGARYGEITADKVFLLSYKEMTELVSSANRWCEPTRHVSDQGVYTERHSDMKTCGYWLRTSAFLTNAAMVSADGQIEPSRLHDALGVVRPALWVRASAVGAD